MSPPDHWCLKKKINKNVQSSNIDSKNWKQPKSSSVEWVNTVTYLYTGYYTAMKISELQLHIVDDFWKCNAM